MKKLLALASATLMATLPIHAGDSIVIKGSDTLGARLVPQLKEAFLVKNPGIDIPIAAEGSATGIAAIMDNTAQIGMSSREVTATEIADAQVKGVTFKPTIVAYDGICVIVNSANPIKNLTKKQVEKIFTGEITDWSAVGGTPGPISIYTRNTSSGTYKDFQGMAMNKRDYATSSQKMAGNEEIAEEVGKNGGGIGYVGMAYAKANGIKVVTIDDVEPSADNVRSKKYIYARATYYYTNGEPTGLTKKFVDFTLSDEGQKIVSQVGFVPVK
ncbi:MAG TPA: phosphate ABC transporter substrate-binding protein [Chthoniobacteraceae bacterium]|nr:phosphate ABC transporter substrate-binding protein [Chthoniobacteraceae bacterium]